MIFNNGYMGWYSSLNARHYELSGVNSVPLFFELNKIPAFEFIIDSNIADSPTLELFDVNNNAVVVAGLTVTKENDTNEAGNEYTRFIRTELVTSGKSEGEYYLKLTYGATVWYGDVFCWQSDLSDYFKIESTSSDLGLGDYKLNLTGFTYKVYIEFGDSDDSFEIDEEAEEKPEGQITIYATNQHIESVELAVHWFLQSFLNIQRLMSVNGTVIVTIGGESLEIYDIQPFEITSSENDSKYKNGKQKIGKFEYKVSDYTQVRNEL